MTRWPVWPILGLLGSVVYLLIPSPVVGSSLSAGVGVAALVVIALGVRRHRASKTCSWLTMNAGLLCWVAGDTTYAVYQHSGSAPYPNFSDVWYLLGYLLLVVGLTGVIHERRRHDLSPLFDSAVIVTGNGLVFWVFVIAPILRDTSQPLLARLVSGTYSIAGVLLLGVLVPLVFRAVRRTPSVALLTLGSAAAGGNLIYSLLPGADPILDKVAFAAFFVTYLCFAGAAAHPSADQVTPDTGPDQFGPVRLVLLAGSTMLAPAVLVAEGLRRPQDIDWPAIAAGAVVISLAMLARLYQFMLRVRAQTTQLEELAMRDELTGLPNRRLFERRLREAMPAGSLQVAMLDLDGFKNVNDRFGHAVGDRLLAAVAGRLSAVLRDGDLVARMGGDEFAVLVLDASPAMMDSIVYRLTAALRRPVEVDGHELLVGTAVGAADTTGTTDPYEVLRRADVAMYASKQSADRGPRRHTAAMDERADELARLGAEMRAAIDAGQFHLVYQPIVELPSGRRVAAEALVRWRHPERGPVSPGEFVPVAEQNGLIVELGAWILQSACAQAVAWRAELGPDAPRRISVNVSARQLAEPGFPDVVAQVLAWTGLDPAGLVIEVTETAVFGGGQAVRAVEALHGMGVRIALDDFGTGHSSLGLLQKVPVDVLKVDKSFVDDITKAGRHAVIATSLIHVADGLGLQAVAEGVETAEQAAELYRLGYRYAQGYHFGRPVPAGEFGAGGPGGGSRSAPATDTPFATPRAPG